MSKKNKIISNVIPSPKISPKFYQFVNDLRDTIDYQKVCEEEEDPLKKVILCKKYLSSNKWSSLLENFIKRRFHLRNRENNTSGDAISKNNKRIEIKVSLGTEDGGFNFVQLRPDHQLDYYLFLAYSLREGDLGRLYWFLAPPDELYSLLPEYGGYAHGSKESLGEIKIENIYGRNLEYALRPNPTKSENTKPRRLWEEFRKRFEIAEEEIRGKI